MRRRSRGRACPCTRDGRVLGREWKLLFSLRSTTCLHEKSAASAVLKVSLTRLIFSIANRLLASSCYATEHSPTSTFNFADIATGQWGAFVRADLLCGIVSGCTETGKGKRKGNRENSELSSSCHDVRTAHSG